MKAAISVVIPLYNAGPWVEQTLASLREQELGPAQIELIVVDDGSTDDGPARVQAALAELPFTATMLRTANGGPSSARNVGWRAATGEWIQFLDADDLLASDKLATQLGHCATLDDQAAVVYSPWQHFVELGGQWGLDGPVLRPELGGTPLDGLLASANFIQLGAALFRRTWLERVAGFDERHRLIEDVDLMLRIAIAGGGFTAAPTPQPLFFYRQRPDSLSQSDQRAFVEGCVRNARMLEQHWRGHGELTRTRAQRLAEVYFQGARFFAATDPACFEKLVCAIEALTPGALPSGPPMLRALSRLIGYRRAEQAATHYRRVKALMRS